MFSFCVAGKERALITCCKENDLSVMDGVHIPVERSAALMKGDTEMNKVLLINSSPNEFECTYTALKEIADTLLENEVECRF